MGKEELERGLAGRPGMHRGGEVEDSFSRNWEKSKSPGGPPEKMTKLKKHLKMCSSCCCCCFGLGSQRWPPRAQLLCMDGNHRNGGALAGGDRFRGFFSSTRCLCFSPLFIRCVGRTMVGCRAVDREEGHPQPTEPGSIPQAPEGSLEVLSIQ